MIQSPLFSPSQAAWYYDGFRDVIRVARVERVLPGMDPSYVMSNGETKVERALVRTREEAMERRRRMRAI